MKLVMIAGPDGAGKTTAATHLLQGALRVSGILSRRQSAGDATIADGFCLFFIDS